ncbi:MAG: alpha/beta fold hydrolase [Emticicia sp.]|uniref:alpha/beta fold hydrolase n=1 Tax=Emticicia sp. TaxID=1930953 RepID=UPI003BA76EB2
MKTYLILLLSLIVGFTFAQSPIAKGEHFATINGLKLHYEVSGNGPVCIFPTPGWGPNLDAYKNSMPELEKYFTVVWLDTRASGKSAASDKPEDYQTADFIEDIEQLRLHLKQNKIWVIGHSMGGYQVLNYGIKYSKYLNGIIAVAAFVGLDELAQTELMKAVEKRKNEPYYKIGSGILMGTDTTKRSLNEEMPYIMPFYFHDQANLPKFLAIKNVQLSQKAWEMTAKGGLGREKIIDLLPKITVPTLVLVGDDDFICDQVSHAARIHAGIKNANLSVIKNAGHFIWIEQPQTFYQAIEEWLKTKK